MESQANKIAAHFHRHLASSYPKPKQRPKKPYVSEELWNLRAQKHALRRQLRMCRSLMRREALARVFTAWRSGQGQDHTLDLSFNYGTSLRIGCFHRYIEFATVSTKLRKKLLQSRSQIQQLLKPFKGPSNKLRQGLAPLPLIKDARGEFCRTAEDAL